MRAIQMKCGAKVEVLWHHEDDWFTLASLAHDLTVQDLIQEFGLVTLNEYRVRAKEGDRSGEKVTSVVGVRCFSWTVDAD